MKTIANKTVVLTGASGGIGAFIARALAKEGATVVCISRSHDGLAQICDEVEALGGKGIAIPFDLCKLEELSLLVDKIQHLAGEVDILINNAAIEKFRPFQNYTLQDIQGILTTNLTVPMELTRLVLPGMLEQNSGHIVNISSGAGKKGAPFNSIYSASKAGLIMWSDALRQELASTEVGISVVCPGVTDAGMFHALDMGESNKLQVTPPTEVADIIIQSIKQNQKEVMLDGLVTKIFLAVSQLSPQFGDTVLQKLGVVANNQSCAQKQMQAENLVKN